MTTEISTVAYLGPEGSFCHQAARMLHTHGDEFIPMKDVKSVVAAVESGQVRHGLVPIENSVEGEVTSTVHEIVFNTANVFVREEVVIPVSFHAYTNSPHSQPTTVVSHPFALAKCQNFIASSHLAVKSADSTSAACENLAKNPDPTVVALGSVLAGELYGLHVYKENVEDNTAAHTKFYLLSRSLPAQRTQDDPLRTELGAYCFILTTEGWIGDAAVTDALQELYNIGSTVRVLGSFQAWAGDGVVPSLAGLGTVSPGSNAGFTQSLPTIPRDR